MSLGPKRTYIFDGGLSLEQCVIGIWWLRFIQRKTKQIKFQLVIYFIIYNLRVSYIRPMTEKKYKNLIQIINHLPKW